MLRRRLDRGEIDKNHLDYCQQHNLDMLADGSLLRRTKERAFLDHGNNYHGITFQVFTICKNTFGHDRGRQDADRGEIVPKCYHGPGLRLDQIWRPGAVKNRPKNPKTNFKTFLDLFEKIVRTPFHGYLFHGYETPERRRWPRTAAGRSAAATRQTTSAASPAACSTGATSPTWPPSWPSAEGQARYRGASQPALTAVLLSLR